MKSHGRFLFVALLAVVLAACGGNGGSSQGQQQVRDTTPPAITLTGDNPQVIAFGEAYAELGAIASDNVDGDVTASIVIDATSVDTAPGDYTVTYNVNDAAGNAAVTVTRTVTVQPPIPEQAEVSVEGDIKQLIFTWDAVATATHYRLLENPDGHSGFTQVGDNIPSAELSVTKGIAVHIFDFDNALYTLDACNSGGCSSSNVVSVTDLMPATIGSFSSPYVGEFYMAALSPDASTLAVGAPDFAVDSNGRACTDWTSCAGDPVGAVHVYRSEDQGWSEVTRLQASNGDAWDNFGTSVAVSTDGNTVVVGADAEDSSATSINGDQADNSAGAAGAVYPFWFDGRDWHQQAYIKASNTEAYDHFGSTVALSADGNTLAVGAYWESSSATGIDGDQADNSAGASGAVYVFRFDGSNWNQQSYIKASNAGMGDKFGYAIALSTDGDTLVVGAIEEDSSATGIEGDQNNDEATTAGAVYVYRYDIDGWYQQAYIKASNAAPQNGFGFSLSLSSDADLLAVGATYKSDWGWDFGGATYCVEHANLPVGAFGAVYLYRFDGSNWVEKELFDDKYHRYGGLFGYSVSLSGNGNLLAAGAILETIQNPDTTAVASGTVHLFEFDSLNWNEKPLIHGLVAPYHFELDYFGSPVGLSEDGRTLIVGAQCAGNNWTRTGEVYVY